MSFERYFRLAGCDEHEQLLRFLVGLSPAALHGGYLVDPASIDLAAHRGPSTSMACELCAGMAATEALKILLRRGPVLAAPHGLQFDAYLQRLHRSWRPWGNHNPLQRLSLTLARRRLRASAAARPVQEEAPPDITERILHRARWAPSGDNTQPWRFELLGTRRFVVHGFDTRKDCVYDLDGHASWLALGALIENIHIAAGDEGLRARVRRRPESPEANPEFDVDLIDAPEDRPQPLAPFIELRHVQRRPLSSRPLTARAKQRLQAAVGEGYTVRWFEGMRGRLRMALLNFQNAGLRLTLPEAFATHRRVIAWNATHSKDRIPDRALGASRLTLLLMRSAMHSWKRIQFLNRYLAGTVLPRIEMDLLPGLACGAHFVICAEKTAHSIDDFLDAGRAMQRFWLTATQLGLQMQPQYTPLVFSSYLRSGIDFTADRRALARAHRVANRLERTLGKDIAERAVFMGRIGDGAAASCRSTRLPMNDLVTQAPHRGEGESTGERRGRANDATAEAP